MATESNHSNNSEYKGNGGITYAEMLDSELRKEAFCDNPDMERVTYLAMELSRIDPPKDEGAYRSYQEFCNLHGITIKNSKKHVSNKKVILIAAVITIVLSSVVAVGNKFNLFNMKYDSSKNRVTYSQKEDDEDSRHPDELNGISGSVTVQSIEAAQRILPFNILVPHYLPEEWFIDRIQIDNISEEFVEVYINYNDIYDNLRMSIYVSYTEKNTAENSQQYEDDYKMIDIVNIMGQEALIISDNYNLNCSFTFDKAVYVITAPQNINIEEFRRILESVDFMRGETK